MVDQQASDVSKRLLGVRLVAMRFKRWAWSGLFLVSGFRRSASRRQERGWRQGQTFACRVMMIRNGGRSRDRDGVRFKMRKGQIRAGRWNRRVRECGRMRGEVQVCMQISE